MTLADAAEIFAYWQENPPTHLLAQVIARMLGWKPGREAPAPADIVAAPPPGLVVARGATGMPPPVFDVAVMRARNQAHLAKRPDRR